MHPVYHAKITVSTKNFLLHRATGFPYISPISSGLRWRGERYIPNNVFFLREEVLIYDAPESATFPPSWTSRLCYGKVCLCLTNALGRPLVSVSDFGTLGRIFNLNAPATFLEGRKIRVIKYLMNIPQIFSKINLIVRDFRGLVHSWECSALPSSGGPAGKTVQSTGEWYVHPQHQ